MCIVTRKLQLCTKEPKLHQGQICTKPNKKWVKKQSTAGAGDQCCEISQVANFRNLAKFSLSFPSLQQFCSKFPLVRSCIFEFGLGSSCLNRIEDNEAFGLQNYKK